MVMVVKDRAPKVQSFTNKLKVPACNTTSTLGFYMAVSVNWGFLLVGVLITRAPCYLGSLSGAPDFWTLPYGESVVLLSSWAGNTYIHIHPYTYIHTHTEGVYNNIYIYIYIRREK